MTPSDAEPAEHLPDLAADAERLARLVLEEDGAVDLSTEVAGPGLEAGEGIIQFRKEGVLAGLTYADAVARQGGCQVEWRAVQSQVVQRQEVGRIHGGRKALLRVERPFLNLLQRASGIATVTHRLVEALAGTGCTLLHTRKTAPGLRLFDVAAVHAGGGGIHRLDLSHTVMIKDNHWRLLDRQGRTLGDALQLARARGAVACQVEVENETQVRTACAAGADRLLIDNQAPEVVRAWGTLARSLRSGIQIEATGGLTLANVREYARAGADYVSVGALTHSAPAADIALELD